MKKYLYLLFILFSVGFSPEPRTEDTRVVLAYQMGMLEVFDYLNYTDNIAIRKFLIKKTKCLIQEYKLEPNYKSITARAFDINESDLRGGR